MSLERKLNKVDLSGGPAQTLCDLRGVFSGASWNREGVIAFSDGGELFRVTANGGQPQPLGKPAEGETGRFWPQFLPDGRRYLYLSRAVRPENQGIYVASLDSADRKRIGASDHNAAYSPSGHLLFVRGVALLAQAFDVKRLELSGEAVALGEQVALTAQILPGAAYSVSASGVLAWRAGSGDETQLAWFDRSGKKVGTLGEPAGYSNPALSPEEKRLAVGLQDPHTQTRDLWIFDLVRGTRTRLTFDPADDFNPTWSPDGTRIAFTSDRSGRRELYQRLSNGSGDDELLLSSQDLGNNAEDWSEDGMLLLYNRGGGEMPPDLYLLPMSRGVDRKPIPFLTTEFTEQYGQFAPGGRWIAYSSNETGRSEVYVQGVSPDGVRSQGKWQVSTAGGGQPRWRRDGKELLYVSGSTLMAVDVKTDGVSFEAGIPKPLFEVDVDANARRNRFVATRDGQRFLVKRPWNRRASRFRCGSTTIDICFCSPDGTPPSEARSSDSPS